MPADSFLITLVLLIAVVPFVASLPLIGIRDDTSSEFVGVGLRDDVALPIQKRKSIEKPFCSEHRSQYDEYCTSMFADRPARLQATLFAFCAGYENKCLH